MTTDRPTLDEFGDVLDIHDLARLLKSSRRQIDRLRKLHLFPLLRQAIETTRTPLKIVALALGVTPSYLTAMLAGQKPIPLAKLPLLPDDVERELIRLYGEAHGLRVQALALETETVGRLLNAIGDTFAVFHGRLDRLAEIAPRMAKAGKR